MFKFSPPSQTGCSGARTRIKENYGFQAGVFVIIYLQLLEGKHKLVQDSHSYPAHLQLWAVSGNDVVISCRKNIRFGGLKREKHVNSVKAYTENTQRNMLCDVESIYLITGHL